MGLIGMFVVAFGAATVLPFQSEIVFAALQVAGTPAWKLVVVASIGNILGSAVNYWIGVYLEHFQGRRWFPIPPGKLDRYRRLYRKWGVWTLLLSWAPFGDAFTVIAGLMRTPIWLFLLLVSVAKIGRYALLAWIFVAAGT